ncbi:MAG TPA: O-antigen ligase family protein [Gaiellaceae bacterium]|nr:O-antigen ligase family protein [Gaiellaceae bacterium]
MRAIRDLPLAASLVLVAYALFFGGGAGDRSLLWLGAGALVAVVACAGLIGAPAGLRTLIPFAALTAWLAISIVWSTLPDRSWVYANRSFVYLLLALLGLWVAPRTRALALGLAVLLAALAVWTLLGKVVPAVYDYGPPDVARLRGPVGLWNQLALLGAFALPLALWRRGLDGTLLAYLWIVTLALTGSRGGVAVAVVVVVIWFVFGEERIAAGASLVSAALPGAVVAGIAFALPGVTSDGQSYHTRWRDGLVFGALLVVGALVALALSRIRPPQSTPALRRAAIAVGVAAAVVVVVVGVLEARPAWRSFTSSAQVANTGGRFGSASSNYRWLWWKQAWRGFDGHRLGGTGGGSFGLTNLRYRTSYLDQTIEPHNLPLQFLSEAGVVGFVLFVATALVLLLRGHGRRGPELALALFLPAFLLHSLVDVDWDFAAVSAPAFVAAGALAGAAVPARRLSGFAVLAAAGAALLAFCVLLLPWLGDRWTSASEVADNPSRAITLARRARSVDPLSAEAVWAQALATSGYQRAVALYAIATRKEPENPQWWLLKARFELQSGCARAALIDFYRFNDLDKYANPSQGPDDYRRALALVNSGKPTC